MPTATVTKACEICGAERTGQEHCLGRICRACYLQRADDRRNIKETRKALRELKREATK